MDTKRYLGVLKDCFDCGEMPEMGGEILWGTADEITQQEMADDTGLNERQVRFRLGQMRERFARRLIIAGLRDP